MWAGGLTRAAGSAPCAARRMPWGAGGLRLGRRTGIAPADNRNRHDILSVYGLRLPISRHRLPIGRRDWQSQAVDWQSVPADLKSHGEIGNRTAQIGIFVQQIANLAPMNGVRAPRGANPWRPVRIGRPPEAMGKAHLARDAILRHTPCSQPVTQRPAAPHGGQASLYPMAYLLLNRRPV